MATKRIRKISDLPQTETLSNEHFPLARKANGVWLWAGNRVENILSYKQNFPFIDPKLFILKSTQFLKHHLNSDTPHYLYDFDNEVTKPYKLSLDSDGVLEVEVVAEKDEFKYSAIDNDILDFSEMYINHTTEDVEFHKVTDTRDNSTKWYKMNVEDGMFVVELMEEKENIEVLDVYENQELDYLHNETILERHEENLFPHKILNLEVNFGFEVSEGEIYIVLEE